MDKQLKGNHGSNAWIIDDDIYHVQESIQEIVTREEWLLIRLSALC